MPGLISTLFKTPIVIGLFLIVPLVQLIYSISLSQESELLQAARALALFAEVSLAYLALKKFKLALYLISALIVLTGVLNLIFSFIIGFDHYLFKSILFILGCYLSVGGVFIMKNCCNKSTSTCSELQNDIQ